MASRLTFANNFTGRIPEFMSMNGAGFAVLVFVAIAAKFPSEHYGASAMLMALLLGIAFHLLAEEGRCIPGIALTSKIVLRIGVGLLGAKLLGRGWRFALLTGGSVAICGASAAMAIAAILPKNEHTERNLISTVLAVTVLSTVAMIVYPILAQVPDLDDLETGVFLGGTIHDVAQVIGSDPRVPAIPPCRPVPFGAVDLDLPPETSLSLM